MRIIPIGEEHYMAADKPHMNLAVIGHIDHGKSTTVGRMMFETGAVPAHIIEAYRKEAESKGKATFEFAWVMDNLKEERERGITIDIAHKRFDTPKYYFTVVDCPWSQRLRQEHDYRCIAGRCSSPRCCSSRWCHGTDQGACIPCTDPRYLPDHHCD